MNTEDRLRKIEIRMAAFAAGAAVLGVCLLAFLGIEKWVSLPQAIRSEFAANDLSLDEIKKAEKEITELRDSLLDHNLEVAFGDPVHWPRGSNDKPKRWTAPSAGIVCQTNTGDDVGATYAAVSSVQFGHRVRVSPQSLDPGNTLLLIAKKGDVFEVWGNLGSNVMFYPFEIKWPTAPGEPGGDDAG